MKLRAVDALVLAALIGLQLAVFHAAPSFDFVDFDDYEYVVENSHVASGLTLDNVRWAFANAYMHTGGPLTWLSYQLDAELFGVNARAHHTVNVLLHMTASALLYLVLLPATRMRLAAAWIAAIFAIHPLHVESVVWIAERKDVLAGVFTFLAIGAYLACARASSSPSPRH